MITYPYTEDGVRSALRALGKTANHVATNLAALGFRGARADCDDCPLVHYMAACFPTCHTVRVGDEGVVLFQGFDVESDDVAVKHTAGTKAFLLRFDNEQLREFPELERSELSEEENRAT